MRESNSSIREEFVDGLPRNKSMKFTEDAQKPSTNKDHEFTNGRLLYSSIRDPFVDGLPRNKSMKFTEDAQKPSTSKLPPPKAVALEPRRLEGVLLRYLINRTTFLALPQLVFPASPAIGHTCGFSPHPVQPY